MKTILVVDDEPKILELLRDYLENAGYTVHLARDGKAALESASPRASDLIVLDLGLPEVDGLDVTRQIRRTSSAPIIMLTARADETDKLVGLELGADDYMTKPFSPKELVARVRAVFRRMERYSQPEVETIQAAGPDSRLAAHAGSQQTGARSEALTPTEFDLLASLVANPGRVFTRMQLLDAMHGVAFESYERAIDAHIKNIRRKIEPDPRAARLHPDGVRRRVQVCG